MNTLMESKSKVTQYDHLVLEFDLEHQTVWAKFKYPGRPCITTGLLTDLKKAQTEISEMAKLGYESGDSKRLKYQVLSSSLPGVFNLGGDLSHFLSLIRSGDEAGLQEYAISCVDVLYASASSYQLPFTTIALVSGETLGGGFEAALSANVIIAEKSAKFGFPETIFGLFPGMGAFSFLARRLNPGIAKRIIASGKVYTADELYDLGVVDRVVADGTGSASVREFIQHQSIRSVGFEGLDAVIEQFNPLTYKELTDVVAVWVETAMKLSGKNQRLMEFLLFAQERRWVRKESTLSDDRELMRAHA
jgi:DSF synthase